MYTDKFTADSSNLLKQVLLGRGSELCNSIDRIKRTSEADRTYYGYIKSFLVGSGCLCDDIVNAANNKAILLAMIGTRSLLEDAINVYYIKSLSSQAEQMGVANEWLATSNNPKAPKHLLDNKNVAQRAQKAGKDTKALYYGEYAYFCNYTHGSAMRGLLNIPDLAELARKKTILGSIKAYANIIACVSDIVGERKPQDMFDNVTKYLNKYHDSVTTATLPITLPDA